MSLPAPDATAAAAPAASDYRRDATRVARLIQVAGGPLLSHAALHGRLAWVEWLEEKSRLARMLVLLLTGLMLLLAILLLLTALVLVACWQTEYRMHAIVAVLAVYATGVGVAGWRYAVLAEKGRQAFAATREQFLLDLASFRQQP